MDSVHDVLIHKLTEHSRIDPEDETAVRSLAVRMRELQPDEDLLAEDRGMHIAVNLSAGDLKDGKVLSTGFYLNELMQPVKLLLDAGHEMTFATPQGRAPRANHRATP